MRSQQGLDPALDHESPVIHDRDLLAKLLGLLHIVCGEHDGDAAGVQFTQALVDQRAGMRVDGDGGLVQQEDIRFMDERDHQVEATLVAPGKLFDAAICGIANFGQIQADLHAFFQMGTAQPLHAPEIFQVLASAQGRIDSGFLWGHADRR